MINSQMDWCQELKNNFPQYFDNVKVLEIGAANINGSFRNFFKANLYIGLDVQPYGGVDVVCIAHEYDAPDGSFDVVFSTNALEHDMYWQKTLQKMVSLTKSEGLMFFSVPCCVWKPHGTLDSLPEDSMTAKMDGEWANYYKNITEENVKSVLDIDSIFSKYELGISRFNDTFLNFWGIKV
ncbi:MAG: methyltransferase domain-containing protein [Actinomycetota bacterium]